MFVGALIEFDRREPLFAPFAIVLRYCDVAQGMTEQDKFSRRPSVRP